MKQKKLHLRYIRQLQEQFCACRQLKHLSALFEMPEKDIVLLAFDPMYYHFSVRKTNGGYRQIEAPEAELKKLQRKLNVFLQAVYFLHQSEAAHGYIPKVLGSKSHKSIKANAEKHLGCKYLLNMDFQNFFHQIAQNSISQMFNNPPFFFDKHTAYTLSKVCAYKQRLPMGAPTSPVLSNFYCSSLDEALTNWAKGKGFVYTRFVDDLSFSSSDKPIVESHINEVSAIAQKYNLVFNKTKCVIYGERDKKIVTGLLIDGNTVDIVPEYYDELLKDVERLRAVIEVNYITGNTGYQMPLTKFKQEIMGKINFVSQIKGNDSDIYIDFLDRFYQAQEPAEELSVRWTKFGNYLM